MKIHPRHRSFRHITAILLAAVACFTGLGLMPSAHAATATWVGDFNTKFSANINWSGTNTPPLSGDSLVFGAAGLRGATLADDLMTPATFSIAGITFNAGAAAFTINPAGVGTNGFTLTGNVTNSGTSLQTINDLIAMTAVRTFTTTTGGGGFTLGGAISGTGGGITKAGQGMLTLTGANTYTGATNVTAGTLQVSGGGSITQTSSISVDAATGTAALVVDGTTGSSVTPTGNLNVGNSGTGLLTVQNGGVVANSFGYIAAGSGSGTVLVTGAGSAWFNAFALTVGNSGTGLLTINNGGAVSGGLAGNIGANTGSNGTVLVDGSGSTLTSSNNAAGSMVDFADAFWTSNHSWLAYSDANAPALSSAAIFDTVTVSPDSLGATLTGGTFGWSQSGNDVVLNYGVVPEPGTLGLLLVGALGLASRRRRG